ncbi:MAG: site-2 protease family protein [Planctomycetota bacterium]
MNDPADPAPTPDPTRAQPSAAASPSPPAAPAGTPEALASGEILVGRELRASDIHAGYGTPGSADASGAKLQRRLTLPVVLFLATCASTFWVACADWNPTQQMQSTASVWRAVSLNWQQGLTYMGAVLAILLTHEMGHFVMTLRHRIPASYPLCIPVPINPIGTMGALIGMEGMRANRRQIFDIGLAGPLAGLAVAAPVLWLGVKQLNLAGEPLTGELQLYNPVIVRWMIGWAHPQWADKAYWIGISQVNAMFMAGWVGMLITGLNMLPVSQLDGGHTIHGLFGRESDKIARAFTVVAIVYVVLNLDQAAMWTVMLVLVILMGIHHPPTSDDTIELDDRRYLIGIASLSIPILCFPLLGLRA